MAGEHNPATAQVCVEHSVADTTPSAIINRWFVEYNPTYFLSALCMLAGVYLVSDGMGRPEARSGEVWLAGVVGIYEILLIASAAFLYRVLRQTRPAVILGIAEMVYLFDPTFQTEVAAYLETDGLLMSAVWLVTFALKLWALAWAFRLRLSATAAAVAIVAATAMAMIPQLLFREMVSSQSAAQLIVWIVFCLGVVLIWTKPTVTSTVRLDNWGQTVFRRALRSTWAVWAGLFAVHVAFWSAAHELNFGLLLATVPILLCTLLARAEWQVWAGVCAAVVVGAFEPAAFSTTTAMAAAVLALKSLRGLRTFKTAEAAPDPLKQHPYRMPTTDTEQTAHTVDVAVDPRRLAAGVLVGVYLSVWSAGWQSGPFPDHVMWLDLAVSAMLCAFALVARFPSAAIPAVAINVHLAVENQWVPQSTAQWGTVLVAASFVLLIAGMMISWRLRTTRCADPEDTIVQQT